MKTIDTKSVPGKVVIDGKTMEWRDAIKQAGGTGVEGSWKAGKLPKVGTHRRNKAPKLIKWR